MHPVIKNVIPNETHENILLSWNTPYAISPQKNDDINPNTILADLKKCWSTMHPTVINTSNATLIHIFICKS